jgi:hypothetical protein
MTSRGSLALGPAHPPGREGCRFDPRARLPTRIPPSYGPIWPALLGALLFPQARPRVGGRRARALMRNRDGPGITLPQASSVSSFSGPLHPQPSPAPSEALSASPSLPHSLRVSLSHHAPPALPPPFSLRILSSVSLHLPHNGMERCASLRVRVCPSPGVFASVQNGPGRDQNHNCFYQY